MNGGSFERLSPRVHTMRKDTAMDPPCDGDGGGGGGDDVTEKEWLFDFLLSVFKSPHWDAAVMGFIDENCAVFDTGEENKLSYTELHHLFKDLVSSLLLLQL